jgi:hypothetical protein
MKQWIKKFWTPDRESYIGLASLYKEPEWAKVFKLYRLGFAEFLSQAMVVFAKEKVNYSRLKSKACPSSFRPVSRNALSRTEVPRAY